MQDNTLSLNHALEQWQLAHSLGRKPETLKFHREIISIIRANWPNLEIGVHEITRECLTCFALRVDRYCPSRWNQIVSILRWITPQAKCLVRRKLRFRDFIPPGQSQFSGFLAELDKSNSPAGLVVRFLSLTGMRITEARRLKWENVLADRICIPGTVTKNGKPRIIPLIAGATEVLSRLRDLAGGSEFVLPRQNVRKAVENACKRSGVPKMSYHCFRHLFATRCIESGVDVPTVARWLGHRDGGALASKMYFHLLDNHSRQMAALVRIAA